MKKKFRELVKRKNRIHANLELIQWDLETKTPIKSRPYLSELVGELSMQDYALSTSDEFVNLVENLNKESLVFYGPIRMTVKKDMKRTRNILPLYRK